MLITQVRLEAKEYDRSDRATPNFFLQQMIPTERETPSERGKIWFTGELSFGWHQMNFYKTPGGLLSHHEYELMRIMQPIISRCGVSYEDYKFITMHANNMVLQRINTPERVKFLNLPPFSGVQTMQIALFGTEELKPIHLSLSVDDTDWGLLLKFYVMTALRI